MLGLWMEKNSLTATAETFKWSRHGQRQVWPGEKKSNRPLKMWSNGKKKEQVSFQNGMHRVTTWLVRFVCWKKMDWPIGISPISPLSLLASGWIWSTDLENFRHLIGAGRSSVHCGRPLAGAATKPMRRNSRNRKLSSHQADSTGTRRPMFHSENFFSCMDNPWRPYCYVQRPGQAAETTEYYFSSKKS